MTPSLLPKAEMILDDVSLAFPIYQAGSRSLKKMLMNRSSKGQIASDADDRIVIQALQNVSLHFTAGDRVALIGSNGAGKTTLLRVMARIYEPFHGEVTVRGRISPMFDIGLGIDMEMSGLENIRLRALLLGMDDRELRDKVDDIVAFTELGDYIHLPVRTYSSGMMTRLTFGVATCFQPEIVVMDEWIVAGDASFLQKAEQRIATFVENASILVLASHSKAICYQWCNKAVWLDGGRVVQAGDIRPVMEAYEQSTGALTA